MRRWAKDNSASIALVVVSLLVIGQVVAFMVLIPLASKVSMQATSGRQAKVTQCDREPVIAKVADAAYAVRRALPSYSRITQAEIRQFKAQAPKGCPKRK